MKEWIQGIFYGLASIGILDMICQAATNGKFPLIKTVLTAIFGPQ